MLSKGTISAEELRGQMGDRMPIAVSTMAKAVGVSNKELLKMMEQGKLVSEEVLPKFAYGLRVAAREGGALSAGMKSLQAQENRLKTTWTDLVTTFNNAGGMGGQGSVLSTLTDAMESLMPVVEFLGWAFAKWAEKFKYVVDSLTAPLKFISKYQELFNEATGKDIGFGRAVFEMVTGGPTSVENEAQAKQQINEGMSKWIHGGSSVTNSSSSNSKTNNIQLNVNVSAGTPQDFRRQMEDVVNNSFKPLLIENY